MNNLTPEVKQKIASKLGYSNFDISRLEQVGEKLRAGKIPDMHIIHILEYKLYEDKIFNRKIDLALHGQMDYYEVKEEIENSEKKSEIRPNPNKEKIANELGYTPSEIIKMEQTGGKIIAGEIVGVTPEQLLEYKAYEDKILGKKLDMALTGYSNYAKEKHDRKEMKFKVRRNRGMRM